MNFQRLGFSSYGIFLAMEGVCYNFLLQKLAEYLQTEDNSPASFEKALASLSEKIQKTSIRLDGLRQQSRRFSVLWMLYAGFAYLLCSIILFLIVGWRNWGPAEYSAVAGSPVL